MFKSRTLLMACVVMVGQCCSASTFDWASIINSQGDRLPDFSFCGYHASDDALPSMNSTPFFSLAAASGDQTSRIQQAIDKAVALGGGVVHLGAGTFELSSQLNLASNTTLRGSGIGSTVLSVSSLKSGKPVILMGNGSSHNVAPTVSSSITDDYVGIGSSTVTVKAADGFEAGQAVFVNRAVTAEWVRANGMADLVRDGTKQTWLQVSPNFT
jgi:polygalacturonase